MYGSSLVREILGGIISLKSSEVRRRRELAANAPFIVTSQGRLGWWVCFSFVALAAVESHCYEL